jgi:autotransporter strand-loop-strand O-heptosyltransferase
MIPKIYAHCSYIGNTGYNNHTREFFRQLSKQTQLKVRNFTIGESWKELNNSPHDGEYYFNDTDRSILYEQTLWNGDGNRENFKIYSSEEKEFVHDFNLVLNETDHYFFYDNYLGPKVAYFVWETTRVPDHFFNKLKEFDEVWVPTKWQKDCLVEQGLSESLIQIVPEGVDSEVFFPNPQVKHELTSDGRFKFFLAGRWDYRKSTKEIIETFLKTFDKSEPVDLLVSIDNPFSNDGLKTTEERLKYYGIEDERIKVLHFPSRLDYIDILKSCNVFLSCARSEGWNLPLIEAMASGTPSIYSNCSGQLEFAEGKGIPVSVIGTKSASDSSYNHFNQMAGEYYEPDFEELSSKMRFSYEFYDEVKKQSLMESEEIRQKFDWEVIGEIGLEKSKLFLEKINSELFKEKYPENQVEINYLEGPKVEIKGSKPGKYLVEFLDGDSVIHSSTLSTNMWTQCGRKYYTKWKIKVNGKVIDELDLTDKVVMISLESKSIGDTLAWVPYAVEFQKKHNCKVYLSTFHNQWFKGLKEYENINFISPGTSMRCYVIYRVGWFRDENNKWKKFDSYPNQLNLIPLQKTATDILGLEYVELNHGVNIKKPKRQIKEKYITIGPQATAGCKEWTHENWSKLTKMIIDKGYKVVSLTSDPYTLEGVKNYSRTDWDNVINLLYHSEFFIGLGSGLSWLNWSLNKKTFLISNFSKEGHEFSKNTTRLSNDVCIKCWNDPVLIFDPGDWDWCPVYKGTDLQHICQKSITPEIVFEKLDI